jgi:hypothetical protein
MGVKAQAAALLLPRGGDPERSVRAVGARQDSGTPIDLGVPPDIPLGRDTQRWTGGVPCSFERVDGVWYVVDHDAAGGTLVEREGNRDVVHGRYRLRDRDEVLILGYLGADEPVWWCVRIADPSTTADVPPLQEPSGRPYAAYDLATATLAVVHGDRRREIRPLGPKRQKLVRYMASRNAANGGTPVACPHEDLIHAVWGPPETWPHGKAFTRVNLADLVSELRKQLDPHRHLLETITGIGYLLRTRPSDDPARAT